jgi:hypothetical protein
VARAGGDRDDPRGRGRLVGLEWVVTVVRDAHHLTAPPEPAEHLGG